MKKVVLNVAVSIDGFIAGPNGEYDWCFTDQDYGMKDFLSRIDTTLMGRKTFELMQQQGQETFSGMKNYVFSKTLSSSPNNLVQIVSGDVKSFVNELKKDPDGSGGKDLWLFGGGELIKTFFDDDLIDEMMLAIHPLLLGSGIPLFPQSGKRHEFTLKDCKTYPTGLVQVFYKR
ncbi:MAG TPA: dihydrofolate reductase family protein [Chitinophagales bacterium]|nr:dihydrofolate reductase family protein [Chitinophagales bacterium]